MHTLAHLLEYLGVACLMIGWRLRPCEQHAQAREDVSLWRNGEPAARGVFRTELR